MKLTFTFRNETKGALRYDEVGDEPVIGGLYIRKSARSALGIPAGEIPQKVVIDLDVGT